MATEEYSLEIFAVQSNSDPALRYSTTEIFPASRRRVQKLEWTYSRPGGCDTLTATLLLPYDAWGLDFQTRRISQFQHVVLRIRDVVRWTGYVDTITPKLQNAEQIVLVAKGYFHEAEKALISWTYSRQGLKYAGDIGEIAGVVRSLFQFLPLLLGTDPGKPHPIADSVLIDGSVNRPKGLVFDKVNVAETFTELATLAGNFDWGVDENRQFYFVSPQTRSVLTALYSSNPAIAKWTSDATQFAYGDETTQDPQSVPPFLPIEEQAVIVIGNDVQQLESGDTVGTSKNVLIVIAAPQQAGGQPQVFTVPDAQWVQFWGRRLTRRVVTPFFSERDDVIAWAAQRLRLFGRPQTNAKVKAIANPDLPLIHPLGAMRILDPSTGRETVERILRVAYKIDSTQQLNVEVEAGYQPPPDQYFAEQLRRDATLNQNALVQERTPIVFTETFLWPTDQWQGAIV